TSVRGSFFENPLKLGLLHFHYDEKIPSCDKTTDERDRMNEKSEFGRTQESRKSLIRCSRQRNSLPAENRGRREERVKEKGGRRVAPAALDLEGELKIVSERTAPFESGMESSNSRSRYVPFRPIS
ncbi:hypothetical protein ALC62_11622, partial [Cyphomyrmex costatus]